jgi:hypothetical protein
VGKGSSLVFAFTLKINCSKAKSNVLHGRLGTKSMTIKPD